MAVIVQELKIGLFSGVIQTHDLVNDEDRIIVEYEPGSVDAVVGGRNDAEMLIFNKTGELIQGDYPENISIQCVQELIKSCCIIENLYCAPVEIEFQLFATESYILQIRKLT